MTRQTNVNVIGLCHGHLEYENILNVLGIPTSDVSYEAPGINHNIWLTKLRAGEKDIYPEIDRWIAKDSENYWRNWNPGFEEIQRKIRYLHRHKHFYILRAYHFPKFASICFFILILHVLHIDNCA